MPCDFFKLEAIRPATKQRPDSKTWLLNKRKYTSITNQTAIQQQDILPELARRQSRMHNPRQLHLTVTHNKYVSTLTLKKTILIKLKYYFN